MPLPPKTILIISQVFVPDPAAVGQYLADAARELARQGHKVVVFTARNGYDDPSQRYPAREEWNGVQVIRLRWSSFGKDSLAIRLLGGVLFLAQAVLRALFLRSLDIVVVSTSPPIAPTAGFLISMLRGARLKLWLMDLNPDQLVMLGKIPARGWLVRSFELLNRIALDRAETVIVLDRFMAARVQAKWNVVGRLKVVPLWPLPEHLVSPPAASDNSFRRSHGISDRRVVMYSGNHGLTNPLHTLLEATRAFRDDGVLAFAFVGGGAGKAEVERYVGKNVFSLPYQPLATLATSLSAGDVHVVSLADAAVGILHPCKIYGAMALGRPILLLGGPESHLANLVLQARCGWRVDHDDIEGCKRVLRAIQEARPESLVEMGERGRAIVQGAFGREALCGLTCDLLAR